MYQCKFYLPNVIIIIPILLIALGIYLLRNIKNPLATSKIGIIVPGCVALILGLGILFIILSTYVIGLFQVYVPYQNGDYIEIEGEVENLKVVEFLGNGVDEFDVQNIHFVIGDPLAPGYQKQAASNGLINSEGMKVKIQYVKCGDKNIIMSLMLVEE